MQKASWRLLLTAVSFTANLAAAAEPPSSCADKFVGTWSFPGGTTTVMANGLAYPRCTFCVAVQTWTCQGDTYLFSNSGPPGQFSATLIDSNRMSGNGGRIISTRVGPAPPTANSTDVKVPAPTTQVNAGASSSVAQAPPSTLSGGIACHGKDAELLGQIGKEFDAFIASLKDFDETALRKSSSEKYCKWLTDVVLPLKSRVLARLEARMTDECGFDEIMLSQRDYNAWSLIELKRRMSGPCLGVMDE